MGPLRHTMANILEYCYCRIISTATTSEIAPNVQLLPHPALGLLSAHITTHVFFRGVYLHLSVPAGS